MRSLLAASLALLAAVHLDAVADPAAPQINPIHGRHEDAQRVTEQLRDLGRQPATDECPGPPGGTADRCRYTGKLDVESTPSGATVRIDDEPASGTTPTRLTMRAGVHEVTIGKPGFEPQSRRVEVDALGVGRAMFTLTGAHDTPVIQRWWFWVALSAVVVTAIGFGYEATRGPDPHLPGVTCDSAGCRP